jgi:hypothetical protein
VVALGEVAKGASDYLNFLAARSGGIRARTTKWVLYTVRPYRAHVPSQSPNGGRSSDLDIISLLFPEAFGRACGVTAAAGSGS